MSPSLASDQMNMGDDLIQRSLDVTSGGHCDHGEMLCSELHPACADD